MKKILLFSIICLLPLGGQAQINAVLNPSFEDTSGCPDRADGVTYADYWTCLDTAWRSYDWMHAPFGAPEYLNSACRWGATGGGFVLGHRSNALAQGMA